jgi:hypothetical protein
VPVKAGRTKQLHNKCNGSSTFEKKAAKSLARKTQSSPLRRIAARQFDKTDRTSLQPTKKRDNTSRALTKYGGFWHGIKMERRMTP